MDDNEEQSAYWAEKSLIAEGLESDVAVAIGSLVLATKHTAVSDTDDAKLLVDIDLSIPGAAEARFIEYERQIRQEMIGWQETHFGSAAPTSWRHFSIVLQSIAPDLLHG